MKIFGFNYTKKDGTKSDRRVVSLHSSDKWVDGIDMSKLTEDEAKQLRAIQLDYEKKLKPFMEKGFRRFLKEGMEITSEETIKE